MNDVSRRPPSRWRWVLARSLPARDRSHLLEELDAAFDRRARSEGRKAAERWYREEVIAFLLRVPEQGVRGFTIGFGGLSMDGLRQVGVVLRGLRRAPGFTSLAVLTLALGIGANALIFAIADRALFRPLPYPDADELVAVMEGWGTSLGAIEVLQGRLTTVEAIGGATDAGGMTFEPEDGPARRVSVSQASPEYLEALGVAPRLGRLFRRDEARPGEGNVALLSEAFFTGVFGGDPGVLGRSVMLDGVRREIVGVLPAGFDMPSARNDIWIPAVMDPSPAGVGLHWGNGTYTMLARMRPGVTPEQVKEDALAGQEVIRLANPLWTPPPGFWNDGSVTRLREARGRGARAPLFLLLGAVGVVLLVVCANVANLLLSRGLSRQTDRAVRTALGATSGQLAGLQIVEVLMLSALGTGFGLALASVGLDLLRPLLPADVPGAALVDVDLRVMVFTAIVAVVVALVAGTIPALRMGSGGPGDVLRQSGRSGSASRSRRRVTRLLVASQMAAAVVLVSGAVLLGRSLNELSRVDPGFEAEGRVTARLDLPPGVATDRQARETYLTSMVEALEVDPALGRVALASSIPFGSESESMAVAIPGVTQDPNNLPVVRQRRVTAGYFEVAGIPVLRGRALLETDRLGEPLVVVIDEAFANTHFPGEDPVGRMIRYPWRGAPDIQIVGVVGATGDLDLSSTPAPTVWMPMTQFAGGMVGHAVVVATAESERSLALGAVQDRARAFDDRMAVSEMAGYTQLLSDSLEAPRLITILFLIFATSTLVLGCVGVYGVASFSAKERVREIGVRMSLGADPAEIRRSILNEGLWLALPGGAIGLVLAAILGRFMQAFLYEVSPMDPVTFVLTPMVLVASALLAVYLPARRATQIDPARVLREG